jgi:hypothetical protein
MPTLKQKYAERNALFCRFLVTLGDAREAAVLAGYGKDSRKAAAELVVRPEIARECEKIAKGLPRLPLSARRGLERLAFGGVGDALRLLYIGENPDTDFLCGLDLFCVSELKRTDKGIEIKFFDRLKALESLLSHEVDDEAPGASSLYKALAASATARPGAGDGNEA